MEKFITYSEFLFEKELKTTKRQLLEVISSHLKNEESLIIQTVLENDLVDSFYSTDLDFLNEESFKEKLAKKVESIKNTLKEKGKQALTITQEKIMKLGSNIKSYVGTIIEIIKKQISKVIEKIKGASSTAVKSSKKLAEKIKENKDKKDFQEECKNFKEIYNSGIKWIKDGFVKNVEEAMTKNATNEELELNMYKSLIDGLNTGEITLEMLFEETESGTPKIPFFKKLVDGIRSIPPIKQLFEFGEYAEKIAQNSLHKASVFLNKVAGAPGPYQFPKFGMLVGIGLEELARMAMNMGLLALIPGLGIVITIIETIETATTIISLVS
jgi:hypothetical protein